MWDDIIDEMRVGPNEKLQLSKRATKLTFGLTKDEALDQLGAVKARLDVLQHRLFAESRRSVLLVMQAMDAAGKDGTIRAVFSGLNPQGVPVTGFKAPGGREAQHDYLWRVHQACPERGQIAVFNRSHYEDVLVVRVRKLAPIDVWEKRYEQINHFEKLLTENDVVVRKCFLHVSRDEQKESLTERLADPQKNWKFRLGDLEDRALWDDYTAAYQDALTKCSTKHAPWYVVPSDSKAVRNYLVTRLMVETLESLDLKYPLMSPDVAAAAQGFE